MLGYKKLKEGMLMKQAKGSSPLKCRLGCCITITCGCEAERESMIRDVNMAICM
jgi:hypothetical protein